jgi:transcriptional antiterminator NusG
MPTTDDQTDSTADDFEIDLSLPDEPSPGDDIQIDLNFGEFAGEEWPTGADASAPEVPQEHIEIDLSMPDEDEDVTTSAPEADEDDPDVQAALATMRDELASKPGDWYVVHTYSGMENRVKQNIDFRVKTLNMEDFIFETVVPTEDAVEMRNGARKTVTRVFTPGYVLVRMDLTDDSWSAVRHTPSVTGVVGHANQPVALALDEVERMLTPSILAKVAATHADSPARRKRKVEVVDYRVGDAIEIIDGPFASMRATITEINTRNQRLRANVEIMGRETPLDLSFPQIQKV